MNGQYPPGYPPGQFPPQQQPDYSQQQSIQQYASYSQFGAPPGFQQTQAPGPSGMPQSAAPQGTFHIPSPEMIQANYARAAEIKQKILQARDGNGGGKLRFFDIAGPNGQKWKTAFTGFVGAKALYIMPGWDPTKMNFVERVKHFWKSTSKPQGSSINGAGEDSLISKAYRLALDAGNKSAWLRPQKVYIYQGFPYEYDLATGNIGLDPSQCMQEDGTIRPMLLEAKSTMHTSIQDLAQARQFVQMFHPDFGRPILFKKTKTGADPKDVEYAVLDLNQQPLADVYRPGLGYLYKLDELFKPATVEEQIQAIMDAGLPMPKEAGGFQGQGQTGYSAPQAPQLPQGMPQMGQLQQQSYQQFPNPPAANPYQQQAPQQQYQQPMQQQNWPPPSGYGQGPGQPQQQQFGQPFQAPKPLPPLPPGGMNVASTPMIPQGATPQGMPQYQQPAGGGFIPPPPPPPMQQQQGQKPLTPEDLQAMLTSGQGTPF